MAAVLINLLLEYLIFPLVIAPFVAWIAASIHRWTKKEVEHRHTQALQSALENGVRFAINTLADRKTPLTLEAVTAEAAAYVYKSVPDAIKHFGIGGNTLHDLLVPKVPVLTEDQARALTGYDGPIEDRTR